MYYSQNGLKETTSEEKQSTITVNYIFGISLFKTDFCETVFYQMRVVNRFT